MKTKKIYIAGALLVLGLASCTDLDRSPIEQLSDASYWKSNDDAVKAVNDLYNCAPEWNGDAIIGLTDAELSIQTMPYTESNGLRVTYQKVYTIHKTSIGPETMVLFARQTSS